MAEGIAVDVTFPIVSSSGEYADAGGTLTAWMVADGDHVTEGQFIAEVTVNKATGEVLAPTTGTIELLRAVSDVVVQGTPIARITPG